jgi:hypothetical protein
MGLGKMRVARPFRADVVMGNVYPGLRCAPPWAVIARRFAAEDAIMAHRIAAEDAIMAHRIAAEGEIMVCRIAAEDEIIAYRLFPLSRESDN